MLAQNRWKCAAALGWSLLGVALLAGAEKSDDLRARRLVIEDDAGRSRIVLQTTRGQPSVTLHDAADVPRLVLMLTENGQVALGMNDARERACVALGVGEKGLSGLKLNGTDGAGEITMGVVGGSAMIGVRGSGGVNSLTSPP